MRVGGGVGAVGDAVLVIQEDQPDGDGADDENQQLLDLDIDGLAPLREHVHGGAVDVVAGAVREEHAGVQVGDVRGHDGDAAEHHRGAADDVVRQRLGRREA